MIADCGNTLYLRNPDEALDAMNAREELRQLNRDLARILLRIHELAHHLRNDHACYDHPLIREPVGANLRGANLTYAVSNDSTTWPLNRQVTARNP